MKFPEVNNKMCISQQKNALQRKKVWKEIIYEKFIIQEKMKKQKDGFMGNLWDQKLFSYWKISVVELK